MFSFIARRVGLLIPTFFGITLLTFALIRMIPGDPVEVMMGERKVDPEMHAQAMERLGLNKPLYLQYFDYIGNLAQGDLGESLRTRTSVWKEFTTLFPATLELAFAALIIAGTLGLLAGVVAALKRGSLFDHGVMGVSLVGYSMPIFWWGLILIMFFSVGLGWTPVSGRIDLLYDVPPVTGFMLIDTLLSEEEGAFLDALHHMILPAVVLATIPLAVIARMTRSAMLEVLREDYVRTARAKGLSPNRVVFVHGLRNALIPVLTVFGLQIGTLLAGAVLTETIFSWPGIGKWLIESIGARDYPVVQNGILLVACLVILVNFTVDILYGLANPRIRHQR
ncbi:MULTISPECIES: ABC transporter permease subunit [Pseudomonadaceae]|jgi:dipeptide transport system permease protein|uniref:ABC transporter permease subunit n=1 Tax=Pseudomonadaceae TaxID=135621 RepID=UPI000535FEBA|nr:MULTISPECIES: ABC transporter permease subunit [Pseudomonadaceae]AZZ45748.1 peptide ABC transporter permease [Pseudomonadaceae bacterium SI-3]MAL37325.1 peptide ABC transporter permease [Pseudomonas sp.]MBU0947472.1 ABC transporter permease subunit [Gammaproteobacteria bacterium]BAP79303.1 dipeptide ABC transporter permease [Pseudomonas sp. MT-1]KJJ62034.1 peptide ABC transporter permease [Pseudomonas sp. 10B238]|tara:strand:+ start:194 stop:1204 length:1011 start_codon:yes stop_codon:yes gene_type:complete